MPGMNVAVDGDTTTFTLSQSWLNTFQKCPEEARLEALNLVDDGPSDATAVGHGMHAAIEAVLDGADLQEAAAVGTRAFMEETEHPLFRWVQVKTPGTAINYMTNCLNSWHTYVLPQLGSPITIEQKFDLEFARRILPDGREQIIHLRGAWDYEDEYGLWDWKTSNQEWEAWRARRFFIQPTVYLWARAALEDPCSPWEDNAEHWFTYAVMPKSVRVREPQIIPVTRGTQHFHWLAQQVWQIADLWEATNGGERPWPLMDQDWHCSPKWCPAWGSCKGKLGNFGMAA